MPTHWWQKREEEERWNYIGWKKQQEENSKKFEYWNKVNTPIEVDFNSFNSFKKKESDFNFPKW